jgi:hypothetical protein
VQSPEERRARLICSLGISTLLLDGPRCADEPRQIILAAGNHSVS